MVAVNTDVALFPLIADDHPFFPQVRAFAMQIAERIDEHDAPATVHAEIKAISKPDGNWVLDRFYWSQQTWDAPGRMPFRAQTLTYRAGTGPAAWHCFPRDPYLDAMNVCLADLLIGCPTAQVDVLRYVPLRRLTYRFSAGGATMLVGKFKRRSRFQEAHDRLLAVAQAAAHQRASFRVAAPIGLDAANGLTLQEALPGRNLADALSAKTGAELLYRLGVTHRALHMLEVPGVPAWDSAAFRASVDRNIGWIAFIRPELAEELAHAQRALDRTQLDTGGYEPVFCHGDFVPSQVLIDGDAWAVIDFDLCRQGDLYHELATLIAALPYDVPDLRAAPSALLERLAACYLAGYQERAGRVLHQGRLLWYRVCMEVYYLALALKKDWLDLAGFVRAVCRLRELVDQLDRDGDA